MTSRILLAFIVGTGLLLSACSFTKMAHKLLSDDIILQSVKTL